MTNHPPILVTLIEALWRDAGLPEYFLGNGGTNHRLYEFAKLCTQHLARTPDREGLIEKLKALPQRRLLKREEVIAIVRQHEADMGSMEPAPANECKPPYSPAICTCSATYGRSRCELYKKQHEAEQLTDKIRELKTLIEKLGALTTYSFGRTPEPYYVVRQDMLDVAREHEANFTPEPESKIGESHVLPREIPVIGEISKGISGIVETFTVYAPSHCDRLAAKITEFIKPYLATREPVMSEMSPLAQAPRENVGCVTTITHLAKAPAAEQPDQERLLNEFGKALLGFQHPKNDCKQCGGVGRYDPDGFYGADQAADCSKCLGRGYFQAEATWGQRLRAAWPVIEPYLRAPMREISNRSNVGKSDEK